MLDSSVRCVAFNLSTCGTGNAKHRSILSWNVVTSACLLIAHLPLLLLAGRVQLAYTLPLLLDERVERRRVARGRRGRHRLAGAVSGTYEMRIVYQRQILNKTAPPAYRNTALASCSHLGHAQ